MNKIEIYTNKNNETSIEVKFDDDTVWLTQGQIVKLFERDQSVISRHINNVFKEGELDILDGSPPCPPFSMSGTKQEGWGKEKTAYGMKQKNIEDLTWEMIRIAKETMPKVIVCENVKGLTMEYAADYFQRMIRDTEALGYTTVYKVLRGQDYGVPQKRERVFMVSVRDDVMKEVGLNFMNINGIFPQPSKDVIPLKDALIDLEYDEEEIDDDIDIDKVLDDKSDEKQKDRINEITKILFKLFIATSLTYTDIVNLQILWESTVINYLSSHITTYC